jgi:hypothetical protein
MMSISSFRSPLLDFQAGARHRGFNLSVIFAGLQLFATLSAVCQDSPKAATANPSQASPDLPAIPVEKKLTDIYAIHQSVELGGHISSRSGSEAVYSTMINLHTGARILNESLEMRALPGAKATPFDNLSTDSFGYGGDPNSVSFLKINKGRIYDFRGSFRRSRSFFNYDLLDNPLIPPSSVPYVPVLNSPHMFDTVRHNTDTNVTLAPLSPVSLRVGFNYNTSVGPTYSTVHYGAEALLLQNWSNLTENLDFGLDAKLPRRTSISYDHFIASYQGRTNWDLSGLNYALSNGTPVSAGIDLSSVFTDPCAKPFLAGGVYSPTCIGFTSYNRQAPTRSLTPSDQIRFQSAAIPKFTLNGRIIYSDTNSKLDNFNESFTGLERGGVVQFQIGGLANVRRVNTNGDFAAVWQVAPKVTVSNVVDFAFFHMPGTNSYTEADYDGTSMLLPLGDTPSKVTTTPDFQYLNQKTKTDTVLAAWDAAQRVRLSLGFRYRSRLITDAGGDVIPIHEEAGIFGAALQPTTLWRVNLKVDAMYADNSFTRMSPRQQQHYVLRTTYRPKTWLTFAGTANVHEGRDNVQFVNHLEHNRDFSAGVVIAPSEKWSIDANYAYDSVYSTITECYAATPAPSAAIPALDPACISNGTPYQTNGFYNVPTQTGSIGMVLSPVKTLHGGFGYRGTGVNGSTNAINVRQVDGSIQSVYQTPYLNVAYDLEKNFQWKGEYNYYGYGEGIPIGPTSPRNFRGNLYTLSVRYAF